MRQVLIGIQARSGSTRLPKKAFELIGGKTMLDRVIEACRKSSSYLQKRHGITCAVAVLTPKDDPIATEFRGRCDILFEGPEHDVLSRYGMAVKATNPEYIVRVTGDCPLIPPFQISKLVQLATERNFDYISNVDERFRTAVDGADCEVISRKLFDVVHDVATRPEDREHVTTLIRRSPPDFAKIGVLINNMDHSNIKLSVDTPEDLERARKAFDSVQDKFQRAANMYGQTNVFYS